MYFVLRTILVGITNYFNYYGDVDDLNDRGSDPKSGGVVDALVQCTFMVMASLSRVAAENDLSLTQLRVLAILRDRRLRMTELADYLGLERSTLSGLVDRAERRGLIQRVPSRSDRRSIDVLLTPQGSEFADRHFGEIAGALEQIGRAHV